MMIALFEAGFQHAKRLWGLGVVLDVVSLGVAAVAVFLDGTIVTAAMLLLLGLIVTGVWLRWERRRVYEQAEKVRTQHLLLHGRGRPVTIRDVDAAKHGFPNPVVHRARRAPARSEPYYKRPPGHAPVLAMLHESVFNSRAMARVNADFFQLSVMILALLLALAMSATAVVPQDAEFNAAFFQVVQASVAGFVSIGLVEGWLTFRGLSSPLNDMTNQIADHRLASTVDREQVTELVWQYALLQSHGLVTPDWLWRRNKVRIDQEWEQYEAGLSS